MLKIKDESGEVVGVLKDEDNAPKMKETVKVKKEEPKEEKEEE